MKFAPRRQHTEPRPRKTAAVLERAPQDPEVHFSAERDIAPEEIEVIKNSLDELFAVRDQPASGVDTRWFPDESKIRWAQFASKSIAPLAVLLSNDRKRYVGLDRFWNPMKQVLDIHPAGNIMDMCVTMAAVVLLAPERRNELRQLSDLQRKEFADEVNRFYTANGRHIVGSRESINFAISFPDHIADLTIDQGAWDTHKQQFDSARDRQEWIDVCKIGMFLKLFYPARAHELVLSVDEWVEMKRKFHSEDFSTPWTDQLGLGMAVLDAEKAEFTDKGFIHITPRQSRLKKAVPVPDRPHV